MDNKNAEETNSEKIIKVKDRLRFLNSHKELICLLSEGFYPKITDCVDYIIKNIMVLKQEKRADALALCKRFSGYISAYKPSNVDEKIYSRKDLDYNVKIMQAVYEENLRSFKNLMLTLYIFSIVVTFSVVYYFIFSI